MVESSSNTSVALFTDTDLDGAVIYYVFRKFIGQDFKTIQTTEKKFKESFEQLKDKESYKKIYICDLAVIQTCSDIIDLPNVVYINHRTCDTEAKVETKFLKNETVDHSSCTLLIYKKLKEKFKTPLTTEQKKLLVLIDDYDSYKLQFPETLKLNMLYWSLNGEKCKAFYKLFDNGFGGFTSGQEALISTCLNEIEEHYKTLKIFKGDISIGGKKYCVCSTFNNIQPSEICRKIIEDHDCDIVINVNLNNNSLSVRKKRDIGVHLGNLAKKLFNGGGDSSVAGGSITDNFLQLSKLLYPIA